MPAPNMKKHFGHAAIEKKQETDFFSDLLMAMLGPSMYGDAYVAAYFNRPPGIAEENNKFAGVQVGDALTYATSNAAFKNMSMNI